MKLITAESRSKEFEKLKKPKPELVCLLFKRVKDMDLTDLPPKIKTIRQVPTWVTGGGRRRR